MAEFVGGKGRGGGLDLRGSDAVGGGFRRKRFLFFVPVRGVVFCGRGGGGSGRETEIAFLRYGHSDGVRWLQHNCDRDANERC